MLSLDKLHELTGGRLHTDEHFDPTGQWSAVGKIVFNVADVTPGCVYWCDEEAPARLAALAGDAFGRGAQGIVATHAIVPKVAAWTIAVEDQIDSLEAVAEFQRSQFTGQMIAVTGTQAAATTRRMIECVLQSKRRGTVLTARTTGGEHLLRGMLAVKQDDHYALAEMKIERPGHVVSAVAIVRPDVVAITGCGNQHAATESAKALFAVLGPDGIAIINGDDDILASLAESHGVRTIAAGECDACDLKPTRVLRTSGLLSFAIDGHHFHLSSWGRQQLASALVAIATCQAMGLSLAEIAGALNDFDPPPTMERPAPVPQAVRTQPMILSFSHFVQQRALRFDGPHRRFAA